MCCRDAQICGSLSPAARQRSSCSEYKSRRSLYLSEQVIEPTTCASVSGWSLTWSALLIQRREHSRTALLCGIGFTMLFFCISSVRAFLCCRDAQKCGSLSPAARRQESRPPVLYFGVEHNLVSSADDAKPAQQNCTVVRRRFSNAFYCISSVGYFVVLPGRTDMRFSFAVCAAAREPTTCALFRGGAQLGQLWSLLRMVQTASGFVFGAGASLL